MEIAITKKIVSDGKIVGYQTDWGAGMECPSTVRGLYSPTIFVSLVADSGYKVYGYNGEFETPDGKDISDLPAVDLAEIDPGQWHNALSISDFMTDAECSKYYVYKTTSERYEFRKEDSYEINTREELEDYIKMLRITVAKFGYTADNRPLNSFVNPTALYSIDEIASDTDGTISEKLNYLNYRHIFKDYSAYLSTVKYLVDKGVLHTENPTVGEFIKAYYEWGPDGITGDCVGWRFKQNVDGSFLRVDDDLPAGGNTDEFVNANREQVPYIYDIDSNLRNLETVVNLRNIVDVNDFGRERLAIISPRLLVNLKRGNSKGFKYTIGYAQKSIVTDRLYFTFLSSNGYKYLYKTSERESLLQLYKNTAPVWRGAQNFRIATVMSDIKLQLSNVKSESNYILWNMCINCVAKHMRDNTVSVPVDSTYEMLLNIGMSPISAVQLMAKQVLKNGQYESNKRLKDKYEGLTVSGIRNYYETIPQKVLDAFMLSEEDLVDGIKTFIDIADVDNLLERRAAMTTGALTEDMVGYDHTFTMGAKMMTDIEDEDALHYYNNLKFVADCIDGQVNTDAFGQGLIEDSAGASLIATEILMSIVYAELGTDADISKAVEIFENITPMRLLNAKNLFKNRDNAYKGYILDSSRARKIKAHIDNTYAWCYITKIFREISNKPIEETRPYLLEMVMLTNSKQDMIFRQLVSLSVTDAIKNSGLFSEEQIYDQYTQHPDAGYTYMDMALETVDYVSSQLFFSMIGKAKPEVVNGSCTYNLALDSEHTLQVVVSEQVVDTCKALIKGRPDAVRYITVYDFNEYEFDPLAGYFAFNAVNANVTPWEVIPKRGYSIATYSLLPSYYSTDALVSKFGSDWYNEALKESAIAKTPLSAMLPKHELPEHNSDEQRLINTEIKNCQAYEDFDIYLTGNEIEQVQAYVKRWSIACHDARNQNKVVYHMPLKQDIVYLSLSEILTGLRPQDNVVLVDGENTALSNYAKSILKWNNSKLLLEANCTGSKYSLDKITSGMISTAAFTEIYKNLIIPKKVVGVLGNWIVAGDKKICIPVMTQEDAVFLFSNYAVKIDNKYYVVAFNGIYRIGAM